MSKHIKWGIIGAGKIAAKFAADLAHVKECSIMAVASQSKTRAAEFAAEWDIPLSFGSYEELFSTEIDVVYIASRHPFHMEHALLCIKNKVAVMCEKPFGMDAKQVEIMIQAAKHEGVFLMEALWSRFHPTLIKAKELLDAGRIGKVITFHADFGFRADYDPSSRLYDPALGGGALLDIGIYPVFFSYLFFGNPDEILATSIKADTGTDETTSILFKYKNSHTSVLNATFAANTNCEAIIYGSEGKIVIHSRFHESMGLSLIMNNGDTQTFDFSRDTLGYDYEIDHVNQCLRAGKTESEMMSHGMSNDLITILDKIARICGLAYIS